jgi:hypothetical protein
MLIYAQSSQLILITWRIHWYSHFLLNKLIFHFFSQSTLHDIILDKIEAAYKRNDFETIDER